MRLILTLLVRDEEDILDATIKYHLNHGVDLILTTNNLSIDGTSDILECYRRQGVLNYINESDDSYSQWRWVTRMARWAAAQYQADWIIHGDADEFWWSAEGDLKKALNCAQQQGAIAVIAQRYNFIPRGRTLDAPFYEAMTLRERQSLNPQGAPLPPKIAHRAHPEIVIGQGNHSALLHGRPLPAAPCDIEILHFPLRTYAQFDNKIAKGGAAYARNRELAPQVGGAWRALHQLQEAGCLGAWYDAQVPDAAAVSAGLADGSLVEDNRLRDRLRALRTETPR